jgi:hypothetical protein
MSQLIKFIICLVIAVIAYGLGRFGLSALFEDLSLFWLGVIGGVFAATAFFIAGRLLGIVNFDRQDRN